MKMKDFADKIQNSFIASFPIFHSELLSHINNKMLLKGWIMQRVKGVTGMSPIVISSLVLCGH